PLGAVGPVLVRRPERVRGDGNDPIRPDSAAKYAAGLHDLRVRSAPLPPFPSRFRHRHRHNDLGILLEILINLKGTSVVISTVFSIDWKVAAVVGIVCVLTYSYFGGLWTSVMTGTLNTLMVTVPAAIVVAAVYDHVQGGAPAVFDAVAAANPRNLSVLRPDAAAGFGITLAFGLLAATVADQTFWQKVWAIRGPEVARTFFWAGALFYPIPICLGMLGLVGIAFG